MDPFIADERPTSISSVPISFPERLDIDASHEIDDGTQLALDFTTPAIAIPATDPAPSDHRLVLDRCYPPAPAVIQAGWEALLPAVMELAHHVEPERLTLLQAVRKTKNLRGTGSRAFRADTFTDDAAVLDGWLYDVLVPIGTLPIENIESSDRFTTVGTERLVAKTDDPYDANISAQSRNEAMMCLEMLCTKVWYERNREHRGDEDIKQSIWSALEFMYWECGIPTSLTLFLDEPPPLWHPAYEQVRAFNYRQLHAVEAQNLMAALVGRINQGVRALKERRQYFDRRFRRSMSNDARWSRSFSLQVEVIKAKYTAPDM